MGTRSLLALSCALLAGCSFIDDWGRFSTQPGTPDAGTDAGIDADTCVDACDVDDPSACAGSEVCAVGADGCSACTPCTGCDPATCATFCELVPGTSQCECAPAGGGEGTACSDSSECEPPLECSAAEATCLYQCANDAECTGLYSRCVDGFCFVYANEMFCFDGTDDDGDGFTDCADFDCAGEPSCAVGPRGEWEGCGTEGCEAGLTCRGGVCLRDCATAAECAGDYPECDDFDADGVGECTPVFGCDFVYDTGCATHLECRLVVFDASRVLAGCVRPRGTVPIGGACSESTQCEARSECFSTDGVTFTCLQWCYGDDATTCIAGEACAPLTAPDGSAAIYMGREFGACVPP